MVKKTIFLVGNASHLNRGCEAIYLGTCEILKKMFPEPFRLEVGTVASQKEISRMEAEDQNPDATHFSLRVEPNSPARVLRKLTHVSGINLPGAYPRLGRTKAIGALQIGGDNYSLDYGLPTRYMEMDKYLFRKGTPVYLWGASVGPFEARPEFKGEMIQHLSRLSGIFAREQRTVDYLAENGLARNVERMADPAFMMEPTAPSSKFVTLPVGPMIGINLSPLMARYVTGGDHSSWVRLASALVRATLEAFADNVLLIPHVTDANSNPARDDFVLLKEIREDLGRDFPDRLFLSPDNLNAQETKYLISQCRLFVGSRTHATIAAFSTHVPTLSLAYSIKAVGLNEDIYGHNEFCIPPENLTKDSFLNGMLQLNAKQDSVRKQLTAYTGEARKMALSAGARLAASLLNDGQ